MYIQLLIIFLSIIIYFVSLSKTNAYNQKSIRKTYIILVSILFGFQYALRNVAVGIDNYAYLSAFNEVKLISWEAILHDLFLYVTQGKGEDVGYPFLIKLFQLFSSEYEIFQFGLAFLFFSCLGRFVYRNTTRLSDILFYVCIYQALFCYFFFTATRQCIAMTAALYCFEFIKQRKIIPFVVIILLVSLIHKSVLIVLPFYFLSRLSYARAILFISLIAVYPLILLSKKFVLLLAGISAQDKYLDYIDSDVNSAGAKNFLFCLIMIGIATFMAKKNDSESRIPLPLVNALCLALVFTPMAWVEPTLLRVSFYFLIYILVLCPLLVNYYCPPKSARFWVAMWGAVIVFSSFIIIQGETYAFMWEFMKLGDNY